MKPRPRKCACGCGERFVPTRPLQTAKTWQCALRIAESGREKAERRALKAAKIEAKPLSWFKTKAQNAVNAYVRARDQDEPCISCGRWHDGQWHAGHYLSVGSHPELRLDFDNIHKQCQPCNAHKSGNIPGYRPRLIAKIGTERVERLEEAHPPAHFSRDDLLSIEADAKARLKQLQQERIAV